MNRTMTLTAALVVAGAAIGYAAAGTASAHPTPPRNAPSAPVATARPRPADVPVATTAVVAKPVDAQADFNNALGVASTQFGLASGLGGLIGGVLGVGVGCPLGAVTAGLVFAPTGPITAVAALAGCLAGASLLGSIGPVVGGAVLGVPVAIASAVQMYDTLHAAGEVAAPLTAPSAHTISTSR